MEQAYQRSLNSKAAQTLGPDAWHRDEKRLAHVYRAPHLYVIGKAIDLVQGYSYGKYSDGYTGYYWER
jgi:hypothetical protein